MDKPRLTAAITQLAGVRYKSTTRHISPWAKTTTADPPRAAEQVLFSRDHTWGHREIT